MYMWTTTQKHQILILELGLVLITGMIEELLLHHHEWVILKT